MTFTFNGTAVYVYGAKRPNHGYYEGEQIVPGLNPMKMLPWILRP